jgi:hypothetical protein
MPVTQLESSLKQNAMTQDYYEGAVDREQVTSAA